MITLHSLLLLKTTMIHKQKNLNKKRRFGKHFKEKINSNDYLIVFKEKKMIIGILL